jgi:hypothetical protein
MFTTEGSSHVCQTASIKTVDLKKTFLYIVVFKQKSIWQEASRLKKHVTVHSFNITQLSETVRLL